MQENNMWDVACLGEASPFGGQIKPGETPENAAKRETWEETHISFGTEEITFFKEGHNNKGQKDCVFVFKSDLFK